MGKPPRSIPTERGGGGNSHGSHVGAVQAPKALSEAAWPGQ